MIKVINLNELLDNVDQQVKEEANRILNNYFREIIDIRDSYMRSENGNTTTHSLVDDLKNLVIIHLVRSEYARGIVLAEYEKLNDSELVHTQNYAEYLTVWSRNFTADETLALLKLHVILHNDNDNKILEKLMKKAFNKLLRITDGLKDMSFENFEKAYRKHSTFIQLEFSTALFYRYLKGKYKVYIDHVFKEVYHPEAHEVAETLNNPDPFILNWRDSYEKENKLQLLQYMDELNTWGLHNCFEGEIPDSIAINDLILVTDGAMVTFIDSHLMKLHFNDAYMTKGELLNLYIQFSKWNECNEDADHTTFSAYIYSYLYERYNDEQRTTLCNYLSSLGNQSSIKKYEEQMAQVIASREGEITNLENKISRLEKLHNEKMIDAANEYQALERKYKDLQKEIEDTTNLKREIQIHRNSLYDQLIEVDIDETVVVDQTDYIQLLKDMELKIVLFGGFPSFRQKWKETFGDNLRLVGTRDYYVDLKFINKVDVIIFDGKYNNHSLFENVMDALTSDEPIFKLLRTKRSMQLICKDIYLKLTNSNK